MSKAQAGFQLGRAALIDLPQITLSAFDFVGVDEVLRSGGCAFVTDEGVAADHHHREAVERGRDAGLPDLFYGDSVDFGQEIDSVWSAAQLHDGVGSEEVVRLDTDVAKAEHAQRFHEALRVVACRANEEVEVVGQSRVAVKGDGVAADDDEVNASREK